MKKITLFKLMLLLLFPMMAIAQKRDDRAKAEEYLKSKGEVIIEFTASSKKQLAELAKVVSLSHKHVDEDELHAEAYVNRSQYEQFLTYGIPFHVDPAENELPADFLNTTMATTAWDDTWNAYPTYSQYVAKMQYWAATYPNLCTLQEITTLSTGRKLLVLKISDNASVDEGEPEFLYTSSMHGDEITGYPTMLRLIDNLLTNYGSNAEITNIVNGTELYICPLANPNGSYRTQGNDIFGSVTPTRGNAAGIDLNRNYPDPVDGIHPDGNAFQAETLAFLNFERSRNFVLAANYHGGAEVFNFPWDTYPTTGGANKHPHDAYFKLVATEYAQLCQTADNNGAYFDDVFGSGQFAGTTNGSAWYTISGGRQDYNNYFNHNKESTIEISAAKTPQGSNLPQYWTKNRQAILNYMKRAAYGLHGVVTDAEGRPLHAKVYSSGDLLGSWVETSPTVGDYHKVLKAGTYSVNFMVPGYTTQTHTVTVTDNGTTILDVTMVRSSALPTAPNITSCTGKSAALTASGAGVPSWYETATSSTAIATGNTFNTPSLVAGRSYYVDQLITNVPAGPATPAGSPTTLSGHSVVFSTSEPMKLRTVTVNANTAGQIWVELQNSTGVMVESKVVLITAGGVQDIELDFFIPTGTGHRLVTKELSGLSLLTQTNYSLTTPQNFGNVTLTGYNGGNRLQFFNWQFAPHISNRKEVIVTVTPNPVLSTISPTNKIVATGAFTLTVNGSNFRNGESVVRWNGSERATTFVSSTQLTAAITAADIQTGGIKNVDVYNNCNQTSTAVQSFVVNCVAPVPNIANLPTLTAQCALTVTAPTATSSCYGTITGTTGSPLTYSTDGTYQITWTYTDVDGKTATQNQTIVIDDTVAPVPNIANLPTVTAQCSASVTAPSATDACAGTIVATTSSQTNFSSDGTYVVTWNYDDGRGNISSQQQTVIIDDTIAPVPNTPSLSPVTALCSATLTAPTATDNCGGQIIANTVNPTTYTVPGNYTVTWSFNDGRGNISTQNQSVTITAPQVTITPGSQVCPNSIVMLVATGAPSYSWISTVPNTLFANPAATVAYTGNNLSAVYLKTQSNATVTVTGSGGPSCSTTASSVFNVGTTWNGSAWSHGLPSASTSANFTGNYISSANLSACAVSVSNGATVTIASGHDLEVSGAISVADGSTLVISNNANLLQQLETNTNTGSIILKRNVMVRRLDYVYWSSPVDGQNLKLFSPLTVSPPVGSTRFYDIDEATNAFVGLDPLVTTMMPAEGYVVRAPNTWPTNGSLQEFQGTFTGKPRTGSYSIPATTFGFANNLIGNPYPSTVDCMEFIASNPGTMYFFTHNSQVAGAPNYAGFNEFGGVAAFAGGVIPNGYLQAGQGFLHKVASPYTITFTNSMRRGNNDNQFFRTESVEKHRLWLNLQSGSEPLNQILVGYMTGATDFDDVSIDGKQLAITGSSLSSLIGADSYAIQGRSLPFSSSDIVPLGFTASNTGNFSINLSQKDGLFAAGQEVYLKDNLTGTVHNLASAYHFVSEAGNFANRFAIVYVSSPLDIQNPELVNNSLIVYKDDILKIKSSSKTIADVQVYDVRGRLIYERHNINAQEVRLDDLQAEQQVLVTKVTYSDQTIVSRKVVY